MPDDTLTTRPRGWRSFRAGSIMLLVFGAVHLLAVFRAYFGQPSSPAEEALHATLRAHKSPIGPFEPSAWDMVQILNTSYSLLLLQLGTLDLLVAAAAAAHGRLRALTALNAAGAALLLAVCLLHQFPPPALFAAVVLAAFLVSLWRQRRR